MLFRVPAPGHCRGNLVAADLFAALRAFHILLSCHGHAPILFLPGDLRCHYLGLWGRERAPLTWYTQSEYKYPLSIHGTDQQ